MSTSTPTKENTMDIYELLSDTNLANVKAEIARRADGLGWSSQYRGYTDGEMLTMRKDIVLGRRDMGLGHSDDMKG